jgi:hypothetical protein
MRTLKKTLCLVLALALCFSLASVAFASNLDSYTDAESVTYTEAVDVLMGIGVVKGDTETTINPQGDLTREQAAKLVAYAALGGSVADKLSADTDPFDDVAATRWSAGYIQYCVTAGIINGDGNGKFRPTDNVTGYEFAKMMLCVLGYGKNSEYTGKGWSVNVAKDALSSSINLFNGVLTAASNEAINREEAFQVVFNTITGPALVSYSKDSEEYTEKTVGTGLAAHTLTIAENVYGLSSVAASDANGRSGHEWQVNGKAVSEVYADAAAFTFTSAQTAAALTKTLKGYTFDATAKINGAGAALTTVAQIAAVTGNGVLVEVYANADKEITGVVTVEESFGQISKVTAANEATDTARKITVGGKTFETESFAEKDYVLYTLYNNNIVSVIAAPTVQGSVTAKGADYIRIDGTKYEFAANANTSVATYTSYTATYTFYLDSYGYIVDSAVVTAGETALNYVYVADSLGVNTTSLAASNISAKLSIVNFDGTTAVVDYATTVATAASTGISVGDTVYTKPDGTVAVVPNNSVLVTAGFYSYTVNSDGKYTLTDLVATKAAEKVTSAQDITVNKGTAAVTNISGLLANSSTVLTLVNGGTATTYTGIANFPANTTFTVGSSSGQVKGIFYTYTGTTIDQIVVIGGTVTVTEPDVYAVYLGQGESSASGTVYNFLLSDGTTKEYTSTTDHPISLVSSPAKGDVVTLTVTNGYLTTATKVSTYDYTTFDVVAVTAVDTSYFAAAGTPEYFASSYVIFDLTDSANPTVATSVTKGDFVNFITETNASSADYGKIVLVVIRELSYTKYTAATVTDVATDGTYYLGSDGAWYDSDYSAVTSEVNAALNTAKGNLGTSGLTLAS